MRRLHVPPPPGCAMPEAVSQAATFDNYVSVHCDAGLLPLDVVVRAGAVMRELCVSATQRVVLHGDLHHDNILRAAHEPWLAIDPHGILGDPGYDVGALLFNPDPDVGKLTKRELTVTARKATNRLNVIKLRR